MLRLLTRLAVRSARREPGEPNSVSMFYNNPSVGDLGPLSTPAVRRSRRVIKSDPSLTAYPFGQSLKQSLVAPQR